MPVDLFRLPLFTLSTLTAICTFAEQALAFVALPFYFESQLGRTPVKAGFLFTPCSDDCRRHHLSGLVAYLRPDGNIHL